VSPPNFTTAQHRAIHSTDQALCIIAGAGAGKTSVLVERCAHLIATEQCTLQQLLAITFTDRAAQELRERLLHRLPVAQHTALYQSAITTFHGFCWRIVQSHAPLLGMAPQLRVLGGPEASELLDDAMHTALTALLDAHDPQLQQLLAVYSLRTILRQLPELVHDRWNFLQSSHDSTEPESPDSPRELALGAAITHCTRTVIAHYTAAKHAQQALDFHDLEIYALQILESHPEILADYQQQYRHIVVDEFQDTNPIQMQLIAHLFTPPDNTLCIVGDPKQSIYRFRGAQVACFDQMQARLHAQGGATILLPENFRSLPRVIDFVNAACPDIPAEQRLVAQRPHDADCRGTVEWWQIDSTATRAGERRTAESCAVATHIRELVESGEYTYRDIACLFRTHAGILAYAEALRAAHIPFHLYGRGTLLAQTEITDLLQALTVITQWHDATPDDAVLLALLRSPLIGCTADECYRLCRDITNDTAPARALHDAVLQDAQIGPQLQQWRALADLLTIPELLAQIITDTEYLAVCAQLDASGQRNANVEQFVEWCREAAQSGARSLAEFVELVWGLAQRNAPLAEQPILPVGDDAVQLLTIHAAKGNQFRVVIVGDVTMRTSHSVPEWFFLPATGLGVKYLEPEMERAMTDAPRLGPRWESLKALEADAAAAEHARLLYVALTRAEDHLVFVGPAGTDSNDTGWLPTLTNACAQLQITPRVIAATPIVAVAEKIADSPAPHPFPTVRDELPRVDALPRHFTVTMLETYAQCPQKYFLKHVLGVPATTWEWPNLTTVPEEIRGEIIHRVLERSAQHPETPLVELARTALNYFGLNEQLADTPPLAQLLANAQTMRPCADKLTMVEAPFHLRIDTEITHAVISGTIDQLRHTNDGWEIIDYKTDRIVHHDDIATHAAAYALQLGAYALAAHRAGFTPLMATSLYFLDVKDIVRTPVTTDSLVATERELAHLTEKIVADDFALPADFSPPCAACIFHRNGTCGMSRAPIPPHTSDTHPTPRAN